MGDMVMDRDYFEKMYLCDFKSDQREIDLDYRLCEYYRKTWPDSMSNKEAMTHWKEFIWWCDMNGYSGKERNAAKKRCGGYNFGEEDDRYRQKSI